MPAVTEALNVGIAVLRNDRGNSVRVLERQAKSHRRTVIEDVDGVMLQAKHLRQTIDDGSEIVKRVPEGSVFRGERKPESRKIRRHHAIAVRAARNKVWEHMGRCGQ